MNEDIISNTELPMIQYTQKRQITDFEIGITEYVIRGNSLKECYMNLEKVKKLFGGKKNE